MSQTTRQTPEPLIYQEGRKYRLTRDIQMLPAPNQILPQGVAEGEFRTFGAGTVVTIYQKQAGDVLTGDNSAGLPANICYRIATVARVEEDAPRAAAPGKTDRGNDFKFPHAALGLGPRTGPRSDSWEPGQLAYIITETNVRYLEANRSTPYKRGDKVWVNSYSESRDTTVLKKNFKDGYYRWLVNAKEIRSISYRTPRTTWYTAEDLQLAPL